jgi:hypothetical protein
MMARARLCEGSSVVADSPQEYLAGAPEVARPWLEAFWAHLGQAAPRLEVTMFRGVPMWKFADSYLKGYVMFTGAKGHFSAHAIDFDLVAAAQAAIPGAFGGKGSVSVKYANEAARPALLAFVDAVLERHGYLDVGKE